MNINSLKYLIVPAALLCAAWLFSACKSSKSDEETTSAHELPDTICVGTLYSPTSYFLYRDQEMGYDYTLVSQWAEEKGMVVDLKIAPSLPQLIEMLDSGKIDLAAYEIPVTAEYRPYVTPCGPEYITTQVLVQPRVKGKAEITDVTQLVGKDVYVEADSKYQFRLRNLDDELGGGIRIHEVSRDTLITEDLIAMVSDGSIPLTVVDSDIARINATYYSDLDISLPLSFPQKASWGTAPDNKWLADSVNAWFALAAPKRRQAELLKRYFELSKNGDSLEGAFKMDLRHGKVSPYDAIFRECGKKTGLDWRLLAAIGYVESGFRPNLVSWAGARGIMQIMPRSAAAYGLSLDQIEDPHANIATGARIFADLDKTLASKVPDPNERIKFILASYNAGIGHIYDAIALAEKHGYNPRVWHGNVEVALMMKSNPEYYTDPVCRNGYFRGRESVTFVTKVTALHSTLRHRLPS